jgi:hypothetical protein
MRFIPISLCVLALVLIPFGSIAETITIDGKTYDYQSLTVDQNGNIVVTVDPPAAKNPKPSPASPRPAPQPQPTPTPVSSNCPKPPKGLVQGQMPQKRFTRSYKGKKAFALRIPNCSGTHLFWWDFVNRSNMTDKLVTISECPGDFNIRELPKQCYTQGLTGTLYYTTSNSSRSSLMCKVKPGSCYVNIKEVECRNNQSCAYQATHY